MTPPVAKTPAIPLGTKPHALGGINRQGYDRITCNHCSDVIGVYEPLVLVTPTGRHQTSLAADPAVFESDRPRYHRACYELIHSDI